MAYCSKIVKGKGNQVTEYTITDDTRYKKIDPESEKAFRCGKPVSAIFLIALMQRKMNSTMSSFIKAVMNSSNAIRCTGGFEIFGIPVYNLPFKIDTGCGYYSIP